MLPRVTWSSPTMALLLVLVPAVACAPRPRMCAASAECTAQSACVAGRCQPDGPNVKPAIDTARRIVVRPIDLAYLRRGDPANGGSLPPLFALGRDSAVLLLRYAVVLPVNVKVVEAYVVLHRTDLVDDDPTSISLHATRIVQTWEGRSTSWALQPKTVEARLPATVVEPGGPSLVRLDVLDLVRHWPKHDREDQGIAVVADANAGSGSTFALRLAAATAPDVEPYLELYLR
jgi:hypothetical protein